MIARLFRPAAVHIPMLLAPMVSAQWYHGYNEGDAYRSQPARGVRTMFPHVLEPAANLLAATALLLAAATDARADQPPSGSAASPAVVLRDDFETPLPTNPPAGWSMWGAPKYKDPANFTRDTRHTHCGAASFRIHHPAHTEGLDFTIQSFENRCAGRCGQGRKSFFQRHHFALQFRVDRAIDHRGEVSLRRSHHTCLGIPSHDLLGIPALVGRAHGEGKRSLTLGIPNLFDLGQDRIVHVGRPVRLQR
jgi:hypothetical protein